MTLELIDNVGNTLGPTQSFLLSLGGVISATVWKNGSHILARLVIEDGVHLNEQDIQQACLTKFGPQQTPQFLLLEKIKAPRQELRLSA